MHHGGGAGAAVRFYDAGFIEHFGNADAVPQLVLPGTKKHLFCPANWDIIKGLQTALPAMEGNE